MNYALKSFRSYVLQFNLLTVLIVQACHKGNNDTGAISQVTNGSVSVPTLSCSDLTFEWDGRTISHGELLGKGAAGSVYSLRQGGQTVEGLVEKIIVKSDFNAVREAAKGEYLLSHDLKDLYTKTTLRGYFKIESADPREAFAAALVKERVNGDTLADLLRFNVINSDTVASYRESFQIFENKLFEKMLELDKNKKFLWDLHTANIMFDTKKAEWKIVDAELGVYQAEKKRIEEFAFQYKLRGKNHPVVEIAALFGSRENMSDEDFFRAYLDIYFKTLREYFGDLSEMDEAI